MALLLVMFNGRISTSSSGSLWMNSIKYRLNTSNKLIFGVCEKDGLQIQFDLLIWLLCHINIAAQSFHHTILWIECINAIHNSNVRKIQVHLSCPIDQNRFRFQQINTFNVRTWTKYTEAAINIVLWL